MSHPEILFALFAGFIGLLAGGFLNVVIDRLPKKMKLEWERTAAEIREQPLPPEQPALALHALPSCSSCGRRQRFLESLPLLGRFVFMKGKCPACSTALPYRPVVIQLLTALLSGAAALKFGMTPKLAWAAILIWALIALAAIDFDELLLPDAITLPLLWLGLAVNLQALFIPLPFAVMGVMMGYLVLWFVFWGFYFLTGKQGLGFGDLKLLAAIGAWLGWEMLGTVIVFASIACAVIGMSLVLFAGRDKSKPLPFGPYLAMGGLVALFWGRPLSFQALAALM